MILEPVSANDIDILHELQPDGWPDIVTSFEFYTTSSLCFPIKISSDNIIVGVGAGIKFGGTAWLAHIIVKADQRNKGIGSAIVDQLVNKLKDDGCASISLIATELGHPVYKKFGFVDQTDYVFFERSEPFKDQRLSGNIVPYSSAVAEEICSLDRTVSGETRRELLGDKLDRSFLYRRDGKLIGFYLPNLGEGLIVAGDVDAGIELMKARSSRTNKSVVPVDNKAAIDFLTANGFSERKRAKRMIWGKEFVWQPDKLFNRIAGNFG
jgi:Acetyltransferase (GNAT) family/Acetyltransferase (GNAT) domain